MRDASEREVAAAGVATRTEYGFWARFWEGLRNSLGGVCV